MFYVYAIQSEKSGRVYIGQSDCMERRVTEHNSGRVSSTKNDRPWTLLRFQEFTARNEARWFERQLKQSRGRRLRWLGKLGYALGGGQTPLRSPFHQQTD